MNSTVCVWVYRFEYRAECDAPYVCPLWHTMHRQWNQLKMKRNEKKSNKMKWNKSTHTQTQPQPKIMHFSAFARSKFRISFKWCCASFFAYPEARKCISNVDITLSFALVGDTTQTQFICRSISVFRLNFFRLERRREYPRAVTIDPKCNA